MRLLLTGNNDGPLRVARSLREASGPAAVATALQKDVPPVLAKAYRTETHAGPVHTAPDEAAALAIARQHDVTHVVNAFANYRFRRLLDVATCVNVHLSPLPRYRGRHPLHRALINGERRFGITAHLMTPNFDDGDILWQAHVDVPRYASVGQLRGLLMAELDAGFGTFFVAFAKTGGTPRPNVAAPGDYVERMRPGDSEIRDWSDPERVLRTVYALSDGEHPAYLVHEGERHVVRAGRSLLDTGTLRGPITPERRGEHWYIRCSDTRLLVLRP